MRHLDGPVLETRLRRDRDLLVNRRESKYLHLDIPNPWSQIQHVAAGFIGEGGNLGIALNCGNRGSGDKLVRCSDRAALFGFGPNDPSADNAGNEMQIGWHVLMEAAKTSPQAKTLTP
jgi:hypothetical protein